MAGPDGNNGMEVEVSLALGTSATLKQLLSWLMEWFERQYC